jgi:nucleotide-binding universal stress UspA family protein
MTRPIIVPLDQSAQAAAAVPIAAEVAARLGTPLQFVLVHAFVPVSPGMEGGATQLHEVDLQLHDEEAKYLRRTVQQVATDVGISASALMLEGSASGALVQHARDSEARLVVMTTHGRGGVSRLFLGSVADRLIRGLHCPVLLAHPTDPPTVGAAPSMHRDHRRRVLIPLDGSALSECIVDEVLALFGRDAVCLELLRIVPPIADWTPLHELASSGSAEAADGSVEAASLYLQRVAKRLREDGVETHVSTCVDHADGRVILAHAEARHPDLIALTTRGLGRIERAILGSVADKVVRGALVPVLVWNAPTNATSALLGRVGRPGALVSAG